MGLQAGSTSEPAKILRSQSAEVSIIIPTLNEADCLERILLHLTLLNPPAKEVIVVDGGSEDGTGAIAQQSQATLIRAERGGRALQMNLGAAQPLETFCAFYTAIRGCPMTW